MIIRIQLLRNIGQFDSVSTGANLALARLTLVYSENGRGKTTLAAVMRSLATGDPVPITERRRLAAQHPPHVVVECSGGPPPARFENNSWNRTLPHLLVFDDTFIDQNVHSGLEVHVHQRKSLHQLILGPTAVTLNRTLQDLAARIETHNSELRARERAIPSQMRGRYSVDDFCALQPRHHIDDTIQEAERALAAAREHDAVRAKASFQPLSLPRFDIDAIRLLLVRDLPALDSATLARVQAHVANLGDGGEAWVANGMRRSTEARTTGGFDACPFCGQDLRGSTLLDHYRAYFSDEYSSLKRDLSAALAALDHMHGREAPAGFERAVRVTIELKQFWSRFCEVADVTLDTATIVRDWQAAREAVAARFLAKQAAPLEATQLSDKDQAMIARFEAHRESIIVVNHSLEETNRAIGVAKERAATAQRATLEDDLVNLKAVKARGEPSTAVLCDEYLNERAAKDETERQRDEAKAALEQHRLTIFPAYQTAINLYLLRFNAGFRLGSVMYADRRGGPSCTYDVLINNTAVPVGGADSAPGEPSFRNTLSAGDRNTLALAFFFASLDHDVNLPQSIVIIDDPISSLDEHRALTTVQELRKLAQRAAQVIVLSHNKPFLCRLWEGAENSIRTAIEVVRDGTGSTLRSWDVAQDSITEHDRRNTHLQGFVANGTGDVRSIAKSLRPHLEAFLRVACPARFTPGTLLGSFRSLCRQNVGTPEEILSQTSIQELDEIVEYANRFHHDTNPAWETEAINDGELHGFAERTLAFCRP